MDKILLELYSGTQSIGIPFRLAGWTVISVEVDEKFLTEPYNLEQWTISIADVTVKKILKLTGGRVPDVIWASPLCTTFSQAASKGDNRQKIEGKIYAKSVKAHLHDSWTIHTLKLIEEMLSLNEDLIYFIENPRAGMRNSWYMGKWNDAGRYTVTYCQYEMHKPAEERRMKPTDIWTNHKNPEFKPPCKNGAECHMRAPRGSNKGTQGLKDNTERSTIPLALCEHIVEICDGNLIDYSILD